MNKRRLFKIAKEFRDAIEEAIDCGDMRAIREINMCNFPVGCCAYACNMLQRYLAERENFFTVKIYGEYGSGENGESHVWLETEEGLVIDITGDQYRNKKLKFTEPVYVGTRFDGFHDKFEVSDPVYYEYSNDPIEQAKYRKDNLRYDAVIRYMK